MSGSLTKAAARQQVHDRGYTEHYDTGSCGDGGYGSRLYFKKPDAKHNRYGQPTEHATLSRLGRGWYVSVFEK